jgi:hypothetical protein
VAAGRKIKAGGPRVEPPWSKTKRLVFATVGQLQFDITRINKKNTSLMTHRNLLSTSMLVYGPKTYTTRTNTEALLVAIKVVDL